MKQSVNNTKPKNEAKDTYLFDMQLVIAIPIQ